MVVSTKVELAPNFENFDAERAKYSYSKYQCERLGCDHPTTYYPSTTHGPKVLVCYLCHRAEELWGAMNRSGESHSRERSYCDERIPTLPSDDDTDRTAA